MSRTLWTLCSSGLLLALGIVGGPTALWGQSGTIEGRLIEEATEAPLANISVRLAGTERRTVTGGGGRFVLADVPAGVYELIVGADGFLSVRRGVRVVPGEVTRVTIRLAPAEPSVAYRLDPITVTATRNAERLSRVPSSVSVVEGEDLDRLVAQSVDDVIRDLPNVTSVGGPRSQAELPQIRGLGADRVIFRVDGARQDFTSGHKGRLFLDAALLKRVEVVRGQGSALYGSGALGGVISFETKDAADLLRPGETLGIRIAPRYLSGNEEKGGFATVFGRPGPVDFIAAFSFRNAEETKLGTGVDLPFSAYETWSALGKLGWAPTDHQRIELSYNRFNEESTTPLNANRADTLSRQVGDRSSFRETLRLGYEVNDPESRWLGLRITAYRNQAQVEERRLSDGRREERDLVTWGLDAANTSRFDLADALRTSFTYGVEFFVDDTRGTRDGGPLGSFPDGDARSLGLYVQNTWVIAERLRLTPGLRWESYESSSEAPENPDNDAQELAAKFAAQLEVTDFLSLYGSFAEGFNAPRLLDLYISGLHFPAPPNAPFPNNFFVANPNLKPERTDSREGGLRLGFDEVLTSGDGVRFEFTYFQMDAEDFIARDVNVFAGTTTFENLDRVDIEGVEAVARYESPIFFGGLSYGQVRMRNLTDDEPVDDAPADTWVLDFGLHLPGRKLTLGYRGLFAEAQERVTDPEEATPGYGVSDLYARWTPGAGPLRGFELTLRADNVFDNAYRRHGSFIPAPGRSFRIQLARRVGLR